MRLDVGGYELHFEVHAASEGAPTLLLLHGLAGTGAEWEPVLPQLLPTLRVITVDLIGHDGSDSPPEERYYQFDSVSDALSRLAERLGLRTPLWGGYSFGGRLLLDLVLRHPERVGGVILECAHPGIEDPKARSARLDQDARDAELIQREGLDAFFQHWHRQPIFDSRRQRTQSWAAEEERKRRTNNPQGLARCLRGLGLGSQPPILDRLHTVRAPTLLIAGALDPEYLRLTQMLHRKIPASRLRVVPYAGHGVHLEEPDAFCEHVLDFVATLSSIHASLTHSGGV